MLGLFKKKQKVSVRTIPASVQNMGIYPEWIEQVIRDNTIKNVVVRIHPQGTGPAKGFCRRGFVRKKFLGVRVFVLGPNKIALIPGDDILGVLYALLHEISHCNTRTPLRAYGVPSNDEKTLQAVVHNEKFYKNLIPMALKYNLLVWKYFGAYECTRYPIPISRVLREIKEEDFRGLIGTA